MSAAGCIRLEWKGADTGSSMARRQPRALGALECAGDRCLLARDHDLAGRIEVDGLDAPRLASFGDGGLNRIVGEAR